MGRIDRDALASVAAVDGLARATILIVDDTPLNLSILGDLLQPLYHVRVANSGETALRAVRSEPFPDLVLLDIMMPGMDGFEVLRQLRSDAATADIPVIFITALRDDEGEEKGFALGAADYIHKPIRGPVVLARVRAQLQARAAREILRKNNARLERKIEESAQALETAQMQLIQSEKMAAMGQLAAGVAHEINNPIGFVGSNLGTLDNYLRDIFSLLDAYEQAGHALGDPPALAPVEEMRRKIDIAYLRRDIGDLLAESREGVMRVRRIVQDLQSFSRSGDSGWQWADVHQGIEAMLKIASSELRYHCSIVRRYGTLPPIWCIPSQLNQVFMNLLINAGQAVADKGEIVIVTEALGDDTVCIRVIDNGCGIPPENLERIFDPFFTSKPVGKGTGLGLSISWGIVRRHGGDIAVESSPGKGTTFSVTLPVRPSEQPIPEGHA
jgi:two-component system, NtrC family, sensor kinase